MGKLLYVDDDDGKKYEITRAILEQFIGDAKAKAGRALAHSGNVEEALTVFQDEMKRIAVLDIVYKSKFGDPYPEDSDRA